MLRRGHATGLPRLTLIALTAGLLAACARSAPAPVEYRPIFAPEPVLTQAVADQPPRPHFKPLPPPAAVSTPKVQETVSVPRPLQTPERAVPLNVATAVPPRPMVKPASQRASANAGQIRQVALVKPPPRGQTRFAWPLSGELVSGFGPKAGGVRNDGINIAAPEGTPVKAAEAGVVAYVGNELRGFGNLVLLRHDDGWMTAYAHVQRVRVARGQLVERGEVLAHVGRSGKVEQPQLHFEIRKGRSAVDPTRYLAPVEASRRDSAVSRAEPPSGRTGPG